jgi:hypothetical protein
VASITADVMAFEAAAMFDLVLCLQVVEHVPDPAAFIRKLLRTGRVLILSVPHNWAAGRAPGHRHDPSTPGGSRRGLDDNRWRPGSCARPAIV